MALFGFRGVKHDPNLDELTQAVHDNLGLELSPPAADVLAALDSLTSQDLIGFKNARTVEGMQEMFRARSILGKVDTGARTFTLAMATPEDIERELKATHSAVKVLHVGERKRTAQIIRPLGTMEQPTKIEPLAATTAPPAGAEPLNPPALSPAFEHLEATERLCSQVVDMFVKYGQLTSADKEVLKKIRPADYTLEARISALERWQEELNRRGRGVHIARTGATSLLLGATDAAKSEDVLQRRFDTFLRWLSKLIKAVEHKGFKFHGKPVWLPH